MSETVKEGLSEKSEVGKVGIDHDRHGPNQVPKKGKESAKKGGKSFTIR